jgi:iron complex outermembrane receptor protein/hemoglobin/transferrin/lactoferrin receptor protein
MGRNLPEGWSQDYGAVTGSVGAVVRVRDDLSLAASIGRGWRPPSAFELFADGIHGGVAAVQIGNRDLGEESNVNAELSLRHEGRRVRGSLSVYRNAFDDYIYLADTGDSVTTPEGALPVFVYRQADARIQGLEAAVDVAPVGWLGLGLAYTRIETKNLETGALLTQTPPGRLLARLRLDGGRWRGLSRSSMGLALTFVGEGVVSGPDEPFGTPTDPYVLLDLDAGTEWPIGRTRLTLALAVRNLLDREYTDFLWTYKAFAPNPGRDVRVTAQWTF